MSNVTKAISAWVAERWNHLPALFSQAVQAPTEADRRRVLQELQYAELEERIKNSPPERLTLQDTLRVIDCLVVKYGPLDAATDPRKRQAVRDYAASWLRESILAQDPVLLKRLRPLIEKNSREAAVRLE